MAAASVSPVDHVARIDALNALAWELRGLDVDRANPFADEARALAIEHGYPLGQARAARTMAMTSRDQEGLRAMFGLAEEAKQLFDEAGDPAGRAGSRDFLSSLYEYVGDLAGGLALALEALSIAREIDDPVRQGYALSSIGGILAASGEFDSSVEHLKEALQLFEGVSDETGISAICSRLSEALKSAGRYEEARTYIQKSRALARPEDGFAHWSALTVLAEIEAELGQHAEAERLYREALENLRSATDLDVIGVKTQVAIARLLVRRGALTEADEKLRDVLAHVEGTVLTVIAEAEAHEVLAELREAQGDLPAVIDHLRKAQDMRTKIHRRDAGNKRTQLEVRTAMESAKRDAEIHRSRFVELHGVQSKMLEAEKMALVGKLAAGTAHELNSPLGVLRSNTDLFATLTERLVALVGEDDVRQAKAAKLATVLKSCVNTSEQAVARISTVARSFQRFSQLDQAELRTFDVKEGLQSALDLLEPTIPAKIEVKRDFNDVPAIEGWPRELNHAFMTVLQNAVQAIQGPGVISAEIRATDELVLVLVRDTGRGMSEAQAAHLFDVAWSEDGTRTRMRLGLSAAYTTTQKHGGTMEVASVLGEGTTISFRFPIPEQRFVGSGAHAPA